MLYKCLCLLGSETDQGRSIERPCTDQIYEVKPPSPTLAQH